MTKCITICYTDVKVNHVKEDKKIIDFNKKEENKVKKRENDEEFNEMMSFAEKVFINPLSTPQLEVFREIYYELKLLTEVMQYLIEYMAQSEQYSSRYMRSIATS